MFVLVCMLVCLYVCTSVQMLTVRIFLSAMCKCKVPMVPIHGGVRTLCDVLCCVVVLMGRIVLCSVVSLWIVLCCVVSLWIVLCCVVS